MNEIKFGTDGWRAILGQDFTRENTEKVINAIAFYIYKDSKYERKIIIGYDTRNKADEFAQFAAEKLSNMGFYTELSSIAVATPILAYSALKENAYAIMITASHNPPEYLGIKFIPPYGGPAEDFIVKEIVQKLEDKFEAKRPQAEYKKVSFEKDYINHLEKIINTDVIKNSGIKINYDGHHGAAAHTFKNILNKHEITCNFLNMERDITFGNNMPDPKEKYLPELKSKCKEKGLIGLSNDGDGDRFGVFDEKGNFISPNAVIVMLLKHLVKYKKYTGKLAKTVGASSMLDLYAQNNNIEVIETPVGFKWLGNVMRNNDIIIAGEDSGGISIKGHIPEKDGILANLLIMEMMAYSNKKLYELYDELSKEIKRQFINDRTDLKLDSIEKQDVIINKFKEYDKIGDYKIIKKNMIDGLKVYLEEGSTVLIRKSGTEPLLRVYFESDKEEKLADLKNAVKQLY